MLVVLKIWLVVMIVVDRLENNEFVVLIIESVVAIEEDWLEIVERVEPVVSVEVVILVVLLVVVVVLCFVVVVVFVVVFVVDFVVVFVVVVVVGVGTDLQKVVERQNRPSVLFGGFPPHPLQLKKLQLHGDSIDFIKKLNKKKVKNLAILFFFIFMLFLIIKK
jgi:hypothetical protein